MCGPQIARIKHRQEFSPQSTENPAMKRIQRAALSPLKLIVVLDHTEKLAG